MFESFFSKTAILNALSFLLIAHRPNTTKDQSNSFKPATFTQNSCEAVRQTPARLKARYRR